MKTPVVEVRGLTKRHGRGTDSVYALDNVNMEIQSSQFVAVMGRSGSGKTTLLNLLGGLDKPSSGQARVIGQDLSRLSRRSLALLRRRHVGYVFQAYNLIPSLTAFENVSLPLDLDRGSPGQVKRETDEALDLVGLGGLGTRYPSQLSGGQQQRVAIARAIVGKRSLLLADEPTGALDDQTGAEVVTLLKNWAREGGAVVMVTHDQQHATVADQVFQLEAGRIVDGVGGALSW